MPHGPRVGLPTSTRQRQIHRDRPRPKISARARRNLNKPIQQAINHTIPATISTLSTQIHLIATTRTIRRILAVIPQRRSPQLPRIRRSAHITPHTIRIQTLRELAIICTNHGAGTRIQKRRTTQTLLRHTNGSTITAPHTQIPHGRITGTSGALHRTHKRVIHHARNTVNLPLIKRRRGIHRVTANSHQFHSRRRWIIPIHTQTNRIHHRARRRGRNTHRISARGPHTSTSNQRRTRLQCHPPITVRRLQIVRCVHQKTRRQRLRHIRILSRSNSRVSSCNSRKSHN